MATKCKIISSSGMETHQNRLYQEVRLRQKHEFLEKKLLVSQFDQF